LTIRYLFIPVIELRNGVVFPRNVILTRFYGQSHKVRTHTFFGVKNTILSRINHIFMILYQFLIIGMI